MISFGMKIFELTDYLESLAPLSFQMDYDNAGLLVGNPNDTIQQALLCLDCTEEVVDEAIQNGFDIIIAHHPIIFKGIKKLNGKNYVERIVIKAIKNNIAIYAIHTNLDYIADGVNRIIAEKLELVNTKILSPESGLVCKLTTFAPVENENQIKDALFNAGAGAIGNYSDCSFSVEGNGTFKALDNANPFVGEIGKRHNEKEVRIEVIYAKEIENSLIKSLKAIHPYEEVAFYIQDLANESSLVGAGMIGELPNSISEIEFFTFLKERMNANIIRHSPLLNKKVKKIAICGGSGSFLLAKAIASGADVFVTADFKYHEFFDAEDKIVIADIGHYETEQFTYEWIAEKIKKKFPTFAHRCTNVITNPVHYF